MTTDAQQAAVAAAEQTTAVAVHEKREALLSRVQEGLEKQGPRLEAYLSKLHGDPERFRATVLQAVSTTPSLLTCTPSSIVIAALDAAQLGLEPTGILGGAWMLPYKNRSKNITEAKLIVGYRGYIDLLHRAGGVKSIEARVVYDGDAFDIEYGTHAKIRHIPAFLLGNDPGNRRCVYWRAELEGGVIQFDVLEMSEIEKARKSSKSSDRGPWIDWYDLMAEKTAIRRSVSVLPISVWEARRAVQLENEAEEGAAIVTVEAGTATSSARDRAVALLEGGEDAQPAAGQATEAPATAPAAAEDADTAAPADAQEGRPDASGDEDLLLADAAMDATLAPSDRVE